MVVSRKRLACKCGCREWCTLYAIWAAIRWSLEAAAEKVWPFGRHDNEPWHICDIARMAKAGAAIGMAAVILFFKLDWAEIATSVGFPNWRDNLRPCFCCNAYLANMYSYAGHCMTALMGWRPNDDEDYEEACLRCEFRVTLDNRTRGICLERLRFDRRQDGARGLALSAPVPELKLRADDRLEPSEELPDVGKLSDVDLSGHKTMNVVFGAAPNIT